VLRVVIPPKREFFKYSQDVPDKMPLDD